MFTIIQHAKTGLFYSAPDKWSAEEKEALRFERSAAALHHLSSRQIRDAVLVVKFSDPQYDIRLHPFGETSAANSSPNAPG